MGVPISPSVNEDRNREKTSLQVLYPYTPPSAGEERDCDEGRWGYRVNAQGLNREKLSLQVLYPLYPRAGSFHHHEVERIDEALAYCGNEAPYGLGHCHIWAI